MTSSIVYAAREDRHWKSTMKLFDAHCHLQDPRILSKAPQLIRAAQDTGVVRFAVNGVCEQDWHLVKQMAESHTSVIPCFGLHPWLVIPPIYSSYFVCYFFFFKLEFVLNWSLVITTKVCNNYRPIHLLMPQLEPQYCGWNCSCRC